MIFRSLEFFQDELGFGLGNERPGKLEVIVEYTEKDCLIPVPENALKEKFESYDNLIRYIEDLTSKEAISEADKLENEEYFPYVKAAEPEKFTLKLVEEQKENVGRYVFLIEGNLVPLNEEQGFELMLVFYWESENLA